MITNDDLPLFDLFTQLREAGLPLGIEEYQLVLRALQVGFGIPDLAALARLYRTLWVKSTDDIHLFDYHFSGVIADWEQAKTHSPLPQLPLRSEITSIPAVPVPIPEPSRSTLAPDSDASWKISAEDEVQVAQSLLYRDNKYDESSVNYFIQTDEYFPVTRRQMKQSWRYLRRLVREGPPTELDMEATINKIERQGLLLEPVLMPRRMNRAGLLLLIDQEGSMAPFHLLAHRLVETAARGGRLRNAGIYYFHNYPNRYLYQDLAYQKAEKIQNILEGIRHEGTGVLIFSDAGAARGGFSLERLEGTKAFLDQLRQYLRYIVWLNPMPHARWPRTTASEVMQLVPMFDISRRGLDDAIDVLRGHPTSFKA